MYTPKAQTFNNLEKVWVNFAIPSFETINHFLALPFVQENSYPPFLKFLKISKIDMEQTKIIYKVHDCAKDHSFNSHDDSSSSSEEDMEEQSH